MSARSPKDRSRSPHRTNGTTVNQNDTNSTNNNNKTKKENDSQLRLKSLKSFIQTLTNDSSLSSLGSTYDEQVKSIENACIKEFNDLSNDRIRRMIRSIFKVRKSDPSSSSSHTTNSFLHQDHSNILPTTDRFNSNESPTKKNRSNSTSNNPTPKSSDLVTSPSSSTLSPLDADFLRHAFSQQFRPSLDLAAYFSAAAGSNNTAPTSSLFRPDFSPSNFLQSLTAPPPPLPTTLVSSHTHTNGSYQRTNDSSTPNVNKLAKQMKLSPNETNSIKVLVNAYREAASYLNRSADELEQLV